MSDVANGARSGARFGETETKLTPKHTTKRTPFAASDISLKIGVPSPTQFHIACSILQLCDVIQYYLNFEHNAQNS